MYKCYVAGKLNDTAVNYIKNVHNMIKWAEEIRRLGIAVYVPCVDFLCGVVHGDWDYEHYFDNSQPWLLASDFVFVVPGWETSEGTKKEIKLARDNHIPVFYVLDEVRKFMGEFNYDNQ